MSRRIGDGIKEWPQYKTEELIWPHRNLGRIAPQELESEWPTGLELAFEWIPVFSASKV